MSTVRDEGRRRAAARLAVLPAVVGTGLGLLLAVALVAWVGVDPLLANVQAVHAGHVGVYVALTGATYLLRALRYRALIDGRASVPRLYGIVSVHTLMVNLLPFSAGDLTYPMLLKRYRIAPTLLDGVPSLVLARLQDVVITAALVAVALAWIGRSHEALELAAHALPGLVVGVVMVTAAAIAIPRMAGGTALGRRLAPPVRRIWLRLRRVNGAIWLATLAVGVLVRLVAAVAVSYLFAAVGIDLSLPTVLLITTLYTLLPLLPLNTVAGIGITEAYLVACFVANGIDRAAALAASVQIHALQLLIAAVLASGAVVVLLTRQGGGPGGGWPGDAGDGRTSRPPRAGHP